LTSLFIELFDLIPHASPRRYQSIKDRGESAPEEGEGAKETRPLNSVQTSVQKLSLDGRSRTLAAHCDFSKLLISSKGSSIRIIPKPRVGSSTLPGATILAWFPDFAGFPKSVAALIQACGPAYIRGIPLHTAGGCSISTSAR